MKISPIFYMGNKKKLVQKGLVDLFPKNINIFYDIFGGSGVVSLNVEANRYILNDRDSNLFSLYSMFKNFEANSIIEHIKHRISEYGLPTFRTKRNETHLNENEINKLKNNYSSLRKKYNTERNVLDFYTLMFFSFSQQFRFNSKGEFNMPFGNDCFTDKNEEYINESIDFFKNKNTRITNYDFRIFSENIDRITVGDFVYLDPPYFNTTAVYNENDGWNIEDEKDMLRFCEKLNEKGVKFGMSNVFNCKGKVNQHLIDWCLENNFNVFEFKSQVYCACGKGNSDAKEVFICNY